MADPNSLEDKAMFTDKRQGGYTIWKEIAGTIIGTAPFALMFFIWMSTVQTRLAVLEEFRAAQAYRDSSQDNAYAESVRRIESSQADVKKSIDDLHKYLLENKR